MKIIISEAQKNKLLEAMSDDFSFDVLLSMKKFSERVRYCEEKLGYHIGKGSSRIIFQLSDEKVLKLAFNEKGIAQNQAEYDMFNDYYSLSLLPTVYDESDEENFTFLVSDYVLPASKKDFKHVFNISFETFQKFILMSDSTNRIKYLSSTEYEELIENNEDLSEFANYIANFQPPIGDLTRISSYGLRRKNNIDEIVLLDSGLNDEVYKTYYKRY